MLDGDIARLKIPFVNRHSKPISFMIVSACTCFEIDWPRDTIETGGRGEFDLTFFSANQEGDHVKTIDVILNNEDERGYPVIKRFFVKVDVKLTAAELIDAEKPEPKPTKKTGDSGRKPARPVREKSEN